MFDNLTTMNIFTLAIGSFCLICGLATLITRKIFSLSNSYAKYTEESVRKAAPLMGLTNIILAIGLFASVLMNKVPDLFGAIPAGLAVTCVCLVIGIVMAVLTQHKMVRKEN